MTPDNGKNPRIVRGQLETSNNTIHRKIDAVRINDLCVSSARIVPSASCHLRHMPAGERTLVDHGRLPANGLPRFVVRFVRAAHLNQAELARFPKLAVGAQLAHALAARMHRAQRVQRGAEPERRHHAFRPGVSVGSSRGNFSILLARQDQLLFNKT